MSMSHLGKSIEFWTAALLLHDTYGALGGEKKRVQLVDGLASAKYRDSGQEAKDAMAAQHKLAEIDLMDVDPSEPVEGEDLENTEENSEETPKE